ncbi:MAG TPA: glycosyltransferase family A protein, partial [Thermoleophilia bacterium]
GEVAESISHATPEPTPAAAPAARAPAPEVPGATTARSSLPGPRLPDFTDPANDPVPAPAAAPGETARRLRATTLALRRQERESAALRVTAAGGDPDAVEILAETPAYAGAVPNVTVCMALFEQPEEVAEALESVAVQDLDDVDVIIHDDASRDDSAAVVAAFLGERPWLPARLVRRVVNGGLPRARNTMLRTARAPLTLMLDADNAIYPQAARRLRAALEGDAGAMFAYGALAIHRDGLPDGLLSAGAWDPAILRERNPVDALSLLRRAPVLALGGYCEDDRLHGWEDYELWVRIAAAGGRGVLANGYIGRYRRAGGSMLALSDLDADGMRELLRELHPHVMDGPAQPESGLHWTAR